MEKLTLVKDPNIKITGMADEFNHPRLTELLKLLHREHAFVSAETWFLDLLISDKIFIQVEQTFGVLPEDEMSFAMFFLLVDKLINVQ